MDDKQIVDLYWARSENAISETEKKYGRYCRYIAGNILHNHEDSEECVNDTYLKAWEAMPPHRPERLSTFLGKLVRNLSLDRYKRLTAEKRGYGQIPIVLDELRECFSMSVNEANTIDNLLLADIFNRFLAGLSADKRKIFVRRYWYLSSIKEIAEDYKMSESKVKVSLLRLRNSLKKILEQEGISL